MAAVFVIVVRAFLPIFAALGNKRPPAVLGGVVESGHGHHADDRPVTLGRRSRQRTLAEQRQASLLASSDAAAEPLRRDDFYRRMAEAEARLRDDPEAWATYQREREEWLDADLGSVG